MDYEVILRGANLVLYKRKKHVEFLLHDLMSGDKITIDPDDFDELEEMFHKMKLLVEKEKIHS